MLRKPKMLAWIGICISPVGYVYNNLLRFRTLTLYKLSITPQVCYLQKLLNDQYDFINRGIRIVDATRTNPVYIFQDAEDKPLGLYTDGESLPIFLYTDGEAGDLKDDFIVIVPLAVDFNINEMTSLLNQYKLASKQFSIVQR
jgi:hypothetical protein